MSRELDEACALALGLPVEHSGYYDGLNYRVAGNMWTETMDGPPQVVWSIINVPRFSTDHAAARLLEDEIERRGLVGKYINALLATVFEYPWGKGGVDSYWHIIRATPEQKARAFLKAVKG